MRTPRLLAIFITLLVLSQSRLISQSNPSQLFADVYSLDSLQGFDQNLANQKALNEGFFGQAYTQAMKIYRRQFVINKYDLNKGWQNPVTVPGGKYSSNVIANAPCVNEGFENGNLTGWTTFSGTTSNSQVYPVTPTSISSGSDISVVTTPLTDPYIGAIPASPFGGSNVVKINNDATFDFSVVKLSQTFNVTSTNYLFDFAYWAVMQDAGSSGGAHSCSETPFMLIKIRDNFNILQGCPTFSIVAPSSGVGGCPGIGPLSWTTVGSGINTMKTSNGWQKFSIDLTPYLTSPASNITVEVFVGDCSLGGHFGYAYFDSRCSTMDLTVNTQTLSMPSPTVFPQVLCGGTATMTAPSGMINYTWSGPPTSGITNNTNQTIVTNVPGNYSLVMNPPGVCNPIAKTINLQFVPPTTITASPSSLCASGTNTSSILSASGASQYTWQPGGATTSTLLVTPSSTTIYTLTARTGTCTGTFTTQVTVNPNPTISVVSSNFSVCPGQSATLTALGANSYNWLPGPLSGSVVVVSPTMTTTYTLTGSSAAGCTSSITTNIIVSPPINISIVPLTSTYVCSGGSVGFAAGNATSFTWTPGNVNGFIQFFNPLVTTNYTVLGSAGACTGSTTVTASVNPGPPMTISRNPTITCPGNTTTLSVVSPSAIGAFTWQPGSINASSIVVTPTLAGGYSVSAVDAMGCRNTQTVNPNLSPLPNIVVTPATPSVCLNNSVTLTASGGVSYTWQPGNQVATNIVVSPTTNTTYTVTGTNGSGCTNTKTVTVTVVQNPTITASASPTAICAGSCATITPNGASTYTIEGGTAVKCITTTTTYTVIGRSAAGCTSGTVAVTISVNPLPNITAAANPTAICAGGTSTLIGNGGVTYTWSTGANTSSTSVSPTSTTNYTLTGASAQGCIRTATVSVVVNPTPTIGITPSSPTICPNASVTLTANGATTYTWLPMNTTGNSVVVSPSVNTTYTAIGSNGSCIGQKTVMVTVSSAPTVTAVYSPTAVCAGSCATITTNGAATYTITGLSAVACPTTTSSYTVVGSNALGCISNPFTGTLVVNPLPTLTVTANPTSICPGDSSLLSASGALSYTWQPGNKIAASFYAKPTSSTIYTVTGINATGCRRTTTINLIVNPTPTINVTATPTAICNGSSATLTANGASNYTWTPGPLTGTTVVVSPGTNTTYTVRGVLGSCPGSKTTAIVVNPVPSVSITSNPAPPVICSGKSVTLTASGATTYTWSNGVSLATNVVSPTITTTYVVFGVSSGCPSNTVAITVTVNASPTIALSANPVSICVGASSTLTPSGGITYTLQPNNGTGFIVTPSVTTVYTLTGANASGCTSTANATVFVNSPVTIFAVASPTSVCLGSSVALTAGGGTTYTWMPTPGPLTGSNVTVTPTGTTIYTVTGSNGVCTGQSTVLVTVNPNPTLNITSTSPSVCAGSCATLTANGGSNLIWSNGSTGPNTVVCPTTTTTYSVTGMLGSCMSMTMITIGVNPVPSINANATPSVLCGGASATLTATGAVSYTWQPVNFIGSSVVVLPVGSTVYTVTGTNAQGCTSSTTVPVNVSPAVTLTATATPSNICAGGVVNLQASGATTYTWITPSGILSGASVTDSPTSNTTYTVVGFSSGCMGQTTVNVVVTPSISVSISATSTSLCAGNCATLTATGASSYTWSTGASGSTTQVCPASSTTYSVTGSSGNCFASSSINIGIAPAPNVVISSTSNTICSGASATLTGNGASTYTWNTGSNLQSIILTPPTTTVITLNGSTGPGCNASASFTLVVIPTPTLNLAASSPSICSGFTVALLATGIIPGGVTWQPGGSTSNPTIETPTITTTYTAFASNGACAGQNTITVVVVPLPPVSITANPASICAGNVTTLTASGALTYTWIPSLAGGSTFTDNPTSTTSYTVVGFGASGCPNFDTISVSVVPAPSIFITASSPSVCFNATGTLTASGASSYTWIPSGQLGSSFTFTQTTMSPVTYTVIGDNGGCAGIGTISIGAHPLANVNASASSLSVCPGNSVGLTGTGAVSYTWMPPNQTGASIIDFPFVSTNYSLTGEDANGCRDTANVFVTVNPLANITAVASPSDICEGGTVVLTANGGVSYTWTPGPHTTNPVSVTPSVSTVYTLMANDAVTGCIGVFTVPVNVYPNPTISVSPFNPTICAGSSVTLTANGATNYTWQPGGATGSTTVESPLAATAYTVTGDNGGICFASVTMTIFVNPQPSHVGAASIGTIGCASPNATLLGSCTDTNVSYSWAGPQGYTSGQQNATVTAVWGTFTLTVTDNVTGCTATATVDVPTDNTIPLVTPVASGSISCSVSTVTLNAVHTTTNPAYSWSGPGGFTSTIQSPTVSVHGDYTITVTDLSSTCSSTAMVTVGIHTVVTITASITPATCTNGVSNNDGSITVSGFILGDKYDLVSGSTYTGTATYVTAAFIPTSGIIVSNLTNPTTTLAYSIRLFDEQGCTKDTTLILVPVDCSIGSLGIAKSVSSPTLNSDGSYKLTYMIIVKNYDTVNPLSNVSLTDNLSATFPAPATFTVVNDAVDSTRINTGSSLSINESFDGNTQSFLLVAGANTLAPNQQDTIWFTVNVHPRVFFVPFKNTVLGEAVNTSSTVVRDSSNTGFDPDMDPTISTPPPADNNPTNNNIPTSITFTPNSFFGITKVGEIYPVDNNSYDISYTITVHNLGNDTLRNVTLNDSLFEKTIKHPASYSMRSSPVSLGSGLIADASFDGKTNTKLVIPSQSKMAPGTSCAIHFIINLVPDTVTRISNSAYGTALAATSITNTTILSDTSNAGTDPDVNDNGIWNEPSDNIPTVLAVPVTHSLFIPEGFSPNGDNINQYFVIQGLSTTGDNSITIFNRWGNKVYYKANYDNTWDGTPNVSGTLGKDKLPAGTYYYILEMKGNTGKKSVTGFVVLQY